MKSNRKLGLLLGLTALCLAAVPLNAAVAGRFTLPQDTYWQTVLLPAGSYTFTLDRSAASSEETIIIRQGTRGFGFVVAQAYSPASSSDHSSMLIVDHRVRALHLASAGTTYYFPGHKNEAELGARRTARGMANLIPVSTK